MEYQNESFDYYQDKPNNFQKPHQKKSHSVPNIFGKFYMIFNNNYFKFKNIIGQNFFYQSKKNHNYNLGNGHSNVKNNYNYGNNYKPYKNNKYHESNYSSPNKNFLPPIKNYNYGNNYENNYKPKNYGLFEKYNPNSIKNCNNFNHDNVLNNYIKIMILNHLI